MGSLCPCLQLSPVLLVSVGSALPQALTPLLGPTDCAPRWSPGLAAGSAGPSSRGQGSAPAECFHGLGPGQLLGRG